MKLRKSAGIRRGVTTEANVLKKTRPADFRSFFELLPDLGHLTTATAMVRAVAGNLAGKARLGSKRWVKHFEVYFTGLTPHP
jgi:hypothetical protein